MPSNRPRVYESINKLRVTESRRELFRREAMSYIYLHLDHPHISDVGPKEEASILADGFFDDDDGPALSHWKRTKYTPASRRLKRL